MGRSWENNKVNGEVLDAADLEGIEAGFSSLEGELDTHTADQVNPHNVTKAQLALGNVDNTADLDKPVSTAAQTALNAKVDESREGQANGIATLDGGGKVPSAQLPAYVDDVEEYASFAAFPATGETGKIYVAQDTNKTYRWGGSSYTYITSGAVDSVAGKTGVVTLVKADVGLSNVDNTPDSSKPVSTPQQTALNGKLDTGAKAADSSEWDGSIKTVSVSGPSAGSDGDIWFQY